MIDKEGIVWSPNCLIRWPNLFVPTLPKGADASKTPQYSATAVLSGNEPSFQQFRQEIIDEMNRACMEKHNATIEQMQARGELKLAVKSNGDPKKKGKAGFAERPNGFYFSATSQYAPRVNDHRRMGLSKDQADQIYDGIFGQVGVTAWGWSHPTGGKGISLNLLGVIKFKDGTRLGGGAVDMDNVPLDDYVPEGALDDDVSSVVQGQTNQNSQGAGNGAAAGGSEQPPASSGGFGF